MKTKEELKALKEEVEALNKELSELSEDELKQVTGGVLTGLITVMICSECQHRKNWKGDYCGQTFDCPKCGGKNCFVGDHGYWY